MALHFSSDQCERNAAEDELQPEAQEKLEFLDMLSAKLVEASEMLSDAGGKITMRCLNRRVYKNTMEDL